MKGSRGSRLFVCALLLFCIFLFTAFLVNIPSLHMHEGLPLFPALLAGEAMFLGTALCTYGLYTLLLQPVLARRRLAQTRAGTNVQLWAHNSQWVRKRVIHTSIGAVLFLWLFTINWWGAIWFFALDRGDQLMKEPIPVLVLCAVFVLVGLIILRQAIRKMVEWLSYGRSALVIDTLPGRPGQTFMGRIETGLKKRPKQPFTLGLTGFIRQWSDKPDMPGDDVRRVGDVRDDAPFHEAEQMIAPSGLIERDGRIVVPVQFDIPDDAISSGLIESDAEVIWKISVRSTGEKDTPYTAQFEIPVYGK